MPASDVDVEDSGALPIRGGALDTLEALYAAGDYAGLRTWALVVLSEGGPPEAALYGAIALARLGDVQAAAGEFEGLAREHAGSWLGEAAEVQRADVYMEALPRLAVTHYQNYLDLHPEGLYRERAHRQVAWGLAREGHFREAADALAAAGLEVPGALADSPAWKRPRLASVLSAVVPGAGQLYAGMPREAMSALVVNGVLAAGIATTIQRQNWGVVAVLGFFGIGFYSGNVYGGADAAVRANRSLRDEILEEMMAEGFGPAPVLTPQGE